MASPDVSFTMDATQFNETIKQMNSKFDSLIMSANKTAQATTANTNKLSASLIAKGQIAANLIMSIGRQIVASISKNIPEIGQAFSIAGDIITRNLLYPLRLELMPLLQKMLDWVRDNRAMFAKWGRFLSVFSG